MKSAAGKRSGRSDSRYALMFTALLALVTTLIFLISIWSNDDYIIKLPLLSSGVFGIAAVWLITKVRERKPEFIHSPLSLWMLVFLAAVAIATAFSIDRNVSLWGQYTRYEGLIAYASYACVFFLALQLARRLDQFRQMALAVTAASGLISLLAIIQYFSYAFLARQPGSFEGGRAFATFGNPVMLGGFLVLTLPFALYVFLSEESAYAWAWLSNVALILLAVVVTFTRGSWLAAVAVIFVWLLLCRKQLSGSRKWPMLSMVLVMLVFGLAFLTLKPSATMTPGQRLATLLEPEAGSAGSRIEIWKTALTVIKTRPMIGTGPDTFSYDFLKYKTPKYAREWPEDTITDNAHNYWLQLGATIGLAGLAAFVAVMLVFFRIAGTGLRRATDERRIVFATAVAGVTGYLVHMTFAVGDIPTNALFWLTIGVTAGISASARPVASDSGRSRTTATAAVAINLIVLALLLGVQAQALVADWHYGQAEAAMNAGYGESATDSYAKAAAIYPRSIYFQSFGENLLQQFQNDPQNSQTAGRAIDALRKAKELAPLNADARLLLANAYRLAGQTDSRFLKLALIELRQAENLDPLSGDIQALFGITYAQLGMKGEVLARFKRALDLRPDNPENYVNLGIYYANAGEEEKSRSFYEKALELDPRNEQARRALYKP